MAQRFFEDFKIGETIKTDSRTITQEMINQFAELTGDKNPIHLDEEFAKRSIFKGRVSHGRLTGDVAIGLLWPFGILDDVALGSDHSAYKRPVRPGDAIHCEFTVAEKAPGEKNGGFGSVFIEGAVFNQENKPVLEMRAKLLVKHKPVA